MLETSNSLEQDPSAATGNRPSERTGGSGPQAATRIAALLAFSGLFAGLWSSDGHGTGGTSVTTARKGALRSVPAVQQVASPAGPAAETTKRGQAGRSVTWTVSPGNRTRQFFLETDGLKMSSTTFEKHLGQLPLGLPAGDYRIVDPSGGVGWLRVRGDGVPLTSSSNSLLTTTVDRRQVRFIRIGNSTIDRTAEVIASPRN